MSQRRRTRPRTKRNGKATGERRGERFGYGLDATHCLKGHPWTEASTRWYINKNGATGRKCLVCHPDD